jgi:hypothetical protein
MIRVSRVRSKSIFSFSKYRQPGGQSAGSIQDLSKKELEGSVKVLENAG